MLVYGDHDERVDGQELLREIVEELGAIEGERPGLRRHASLVSLLITTGQLLQALADADFVTAGEDRRPPRTDALGGFLRGLAECVCISWGSGFRLIGSLPEVPVLSDLSGSLSLRMPEGYAFYGVYPEAFIDAARGLRLVAAPKIIGLRSIGTSLAAVVAAALGAGPPVTVRPHGDPFAREVTIAAEIEAELLDGDAHYIIVDEGPGQSGSSFAAMARWLMARDVPLERIAFITSHGGMPGEQASESTRALWSGVQRVSADLGEQLRHLLTLWFEAEVGPIDQPLTEVSGGEWRRLAYAEERNWPAAEPVWERRKFVGMSRGEPFLIKFAGLGRIGERKLAMARTLHGAGRIVEPVALLHGFLVERWQHRERRPTGVPPVDVVADYIGARARLFSAPHESGASLASLLQMAERNVTLAMGEAAAEPLAPWRSKVGAIEQRAARVRTDNRMLTHEWLRAVDGRWLKTDALDHHQGHDLIGCQDVAWDVAGAIVEFELASDAARSLADRVEGASCRTVDADLLAFYLLAYPAFRLGQMTMAAELSSGKEKERLEGSAKLYEQALRDRLQTSRSLPTRETSLVG